MQRQNRGNCSVRFTLQRSVSCPYRVGIQFPEGVCWNLKLETQVSTDSKCLLLVHLCEQKPWITRALYCVSGCVLIQPVQGFCGMCQWWVYNSYSKVDRKIKTHRRKTTSETHNGWKLQHLWLWEGATKMPHWGIFVNESCSFSPAMLPPWAEKSMMHPGGCSVSALKSSQSCVVAVSKCLGSLNEQIKHEDTWSMDRCV